MKNVVTNLYPEYLRYIDAYRGIPWKIDALKPVERRLLLAVHQVAKNKLTKSAKIVGHCIATTHPHGDLSTYESLVGLVNRGLVIGQGNFGSIGLDDMSGAAQRYCLVGNSKISTNYGYVDIEDLEIINGSNLKLECLSYNQKTNNVSQFFDSGEHPTILIETEYGLSLQGSFNHPIVILGEDLKFKWKNLEDIEEGEYAVILTNNNICSNSALDHNQAVVLGCLLSEGFSSSNKIGFNNTCDQLLSSYKQSLEKVLGKPVSVYNHLLPSGKNLQTIEICNEKDCEKIRNLGYGGFKSGAIEIPDTIYKSSKEIQSVFLRHLFQGDGSISIGKRNMVIAYSSISEKLIFQLKELLINSFGIFSGIHYFKNTSEIRLQICNRKSILKFIKEIGFLPGTKKDNISQTIMSSNIKKPSKANQDYIPYIKEYIKTHKINSNKTTNIKLREVNYNFKESLIANLDWISSVLDKDDLEKIKLLLNEDYKFLQIIKKEILPSEKVYCIRVDSGCHSFVSNGFISHNTETKASPHLDNLFSEFLEFAPWQELELDAEPLFLPAPIPIGLVGEGMVLGIGNNVTRIPRYNFMDLVKRSHELITGSPTLTTIIPQIANCSIYEDAPGEFEKILTQGEGVVQCVPIQKTEGNAVLIYGRNPLNGFSKLKTYNIKHEEEHGNPAYTLVDLSKDKLLIQVAPYKGKVDAQFELLIATLISTKIKVICNFVDDNFAVKKFAIDEILLSAYNNWKDCYLKSLNNDLDKFKRKMFEYQVLGIARNIYLQNSTVKTVEDICNLYSNNPQPGFDIDDIKKVMGSYSFKKVIELDIDIPTIQNDINNKQGEINQIDQLCLNKLLNPF